MLAQSLSKQVKTLRIKPDASGYTVAAGAADVNSDIIDTAGFDALRFIVGFGAITSGAATSIKVQQNTANSATGMADLAGSAQTVADTDDNKIFITEILKPQERYVRLTTLRATQNAVIDFALVELFRARTLPITEDSIVGGSETHAAPAEGTA